MKKSIVRHILLAFAIVSVGCYNDNLNDNLGWYSGGETAISLYTSNARTSLGDKGESGVYPVYWNEEDCLCVNGRGSKSITIEEENPAYASFLFDGQFTYPYYITYPYTSTSTTNSPKVVFPTEQEYVEGSFAPASAPMCGYTTDASKEISLKHLAAILKFPVKSQKEGVILQKIVVKSTADKKLSGLFVVNCESGAISATNECSNSVTYTLPANFALSTTRESIFHISIPAGESGPCVVEFVDSEGGVMVGSWKSKEFEAGVVREFKTITYNAGATCYLPAFGCYEDEIEIEYTAVSGFVKDTSGRGIQGVAVSDGFSVTKSNSEGFYSLLCSPDAWYIYISIPSEYEVPVNAYGQPCFYQRYNPAQKRYNFELKPLSGGKESKFALFVLTDIHVSTSYRRARFREEAVPSISRHVREVKASGLPCYGITLGDLISNSSTKDTSEERVYLRDLLSKSSLGFPTFQVMGNHDNTYYDANNPIYADEMSSTYDLKAQRAHEEMFGPVNYSFNRGDVHIIGMRNIIFTSNSNNGSYEVGFTDAQLAWLKQDLALVPKDKMVVLGCHIKLNGETINHISEVTALLGEYKEAHVLTGHSHVQRNYPTSGSTKKVFEHNLAAVAGASWYCKLCEDGCPIGYNVYISNNATFNDWYYMSFNKGTDSRAQQMRLYRGDDITGAEAPGAPGTDDNKMGVKGFYKFNFADNVILANVYNADTSWTIKVFEDGVYSGDMTKLPSTTLSFSTLIGDGSSSNPFRFEDSVSSGHDLYATGLLMGIQARVTSAGTPGGNCWQGNSHMYKYELKNKDAQIKVVATDRFGNEYTETKITKGTDYTLTSGDYKTDANIKL